MATIKVRVQGEIATNLTPEVRLVCQNDKYDVEFEFDDSWENSNFKTALFIYNGKSIAVPFDREQNGNVCKIPALYETELLHIGVKSSDVEGLHTTTPARAGCLLSANDIVNGKIPNPTPSQYDEIIALLNQYLTGGGSGEPIDLKDYQKKVDDGLQTTDKTIVGAINEVNAKASQPSGGGGLTEEEVKEIVQETLPDWVEQDEKPTYTYEEITEKPDLVEDIGSSIAEETNVLTIELKDKSGKVIASTEVTIPKGGETPDLSAYVKTEDRDEFVKGGITENSLTLTDGEKARACDWVGAVKKPAPITGIQTVVSQKGNGAIESLGTASFANQALFGRIPRYQNPAYEEDTPASNMGMLVTNYPTKIYHCANRGYVDNLPDNLTLTDDEKAKWRGMIGASLKKTWVWWFKCLENNTTGDKWHNVRFMYKSIVEPTEDNLYDDLYNAGRADIDKTAIVINAMMEDGDYTAPQIVGIYAEGDGESFHAVFSDGISYPLVISEDEPDFYYCSTEF